MIGLATTFINMFLTVLLIVLIRSIALPHLSARAVNGVNGAFSMICGNASWNNSVNDGGMGMDGIDGSTNASLLAVWNGL
jgi:hypothetical protein